MIKKEGNLYKIYNETGTKVLGTYSTKEEAEKRLKDLEILIIEVNKIMSKTHLTILLFFLSSILIGALLALIVV